MRGGLSHIGVITGSYWPRPSHPRVGPSYRPTLAGLRFSVPPKKKVIPRPVHFETTIPRIRSCGRCGVWLAAGVAEGIKAEVEFALLDRGQAIWAVLNHIELYVFRRTGLVHMDSNRLLGPSLGGLYPQHRCDIRWPTQQGVVQKSRRDDIPPY